MSDPASDTPATAPAPDFAAFEARENSLAIGETPAPEPTPPEPTPAPEPEPEPDAQAAPVPDDKAYTPPSPTSKRTQSRTQREQEHINERIRTSVQEATEKLQAEIAELKAKTAPPAEKPAPAAPVVDPKDPEPVEADFEDYRTFVKAVSRWEIRQDRREAEAVATETRRVQAETAQREDFHTKAQAWIGRRDDFIAKHPEKSETLLQFLDHVVAGTPIGDVILESEVGADVADYLASHVDEAVRIARLPPVSALRALGRLESLFDTTTSASASSAGPAAKTVTSAPAPPMTLASRSAAPADPVAHAIANGDFEAFEAEENRKALAASR